MRSIASFPGRSLSLDERLVHVNTPMPLQVGHQAPSPSDLPPGRLPLGTTYLSKSQNAISVVKSRSLMYSKCTAAVFISVLLLAVQSSANWCEISCSLSGPHRASHLIEASAAKQPRGRWTHSYHSHCDHLIPAKPVGTTPDSLESTSKCSNAACVPVAVLSSSGKSQEGARIDRRPLALSSVLSLPLGKYHTPSRSLRLEAIRERAVLLDTLPINLRI